MTSTMEIEPFTGSNDEAIISNRLPLVALLALAVAGFITILTEALPAGLLPQIGSSLSVSDALAGQLVTIYAVGSLVAAIPLTAATQGMRRRPCFGLMSVLTLVLIAWILVKVPDFPGQIAGKRHSIRQVFGMAGVRPVLFVALAFVLAHNILYTYITPFLAAIGMAAQTDLILLVFGVTSLIGIWIVGVLIDHRLRALTLASTILFGFAALALGIWSDNPTVTCCAVGVWGLAFGGAATLFQTALAKTSGDAADVAQSMLVTAWNTAIAGGGIIGGLLLEKIGVGAFAPALLCLLVPTFVVAWIARHNGFPAVAPR